MDANPTRTDLKDRLARLLQACAGGLVLASATLSGTAQAAPAARTEPLPTIEERAASLRQQIAADPTTATAPEGGLLAWWNWHNWHNGWGNGWHNWHNWHNWW